MIEKQQFKNESEGYVGAVVIGPKGDDRGVAVEPGGTVWLSEAEQTLTANAPRRSEDNPFIPQTVVKTDPTTGEVREEQVTPLVPMDEGRFTPAGLRYVPGVDAEGARGVAIAQAAATAPTPSTPTTMEVGAPVRHAEVEELGADAQPHQAPPVPRAAALAAAAAAEPSAEEFEVEEGSREAARVANEEAAAQVAADLAARDAAAAQNTAERPDDPSTEHFNEATGQFSSEETAAVVDPGVGEETGAALPPTGDAVAGEFSSHEEVGTPDAPQPPPFNPGE